MPTEVLLRPAIEADADALADVHLAARRAAERAGAMPPGAHPEHETRAWLAGRLAIDEVWVAEADGAVVGYARLTPTWLDDLYVVPAQAGRGIGTALLDLVKARRPSGFSLWVFEMNAPARAFYARHGLVELERTDGSANEERSPDVRVAWPGEDPLGFLRSQIDDVDAQLGDLLARRAALTSAVQDIKHDTTRDPDREREIAESIARRVPALGADRTARIVDVIIAESLDAASRG